MTDHDLMLDGITRWTLEVNQSDDLADDGLPRTFSAAHRRAADGEWVMFARLPALIARVREDTIVSYDMKRAERAYAQGRADAARDVAALPDLTPTSAPGWVPRDRAVAAARGGTNE